MRSVICVLISVFILMACKSETSDTLTQDEMEHTSSKVVIYQMMTRLFGNRGTTNKPYGTIDENGVGKFNDISDAALRGIQELGVTHIWYTGVLEHATLTDYTTYGIPLDDADVVKGRAGSPYAIKDYYDVNPDLAVNVRERVSEFEALVARTHEHNMKVIIDFVPNHVARAYRSDAKPNDAKDLGEDDDTSVSFHPNNNYYYLPGESFRPPQSYQSLGDLSHATKDGKFKETPAKVTGNDIFSASPDVNSWFETVKLNYGVDIQNNRTTHFDPVPDTWTKMRDILLFWASKNVDGFRCDMAEMVPVEFWQWVIPQVRHVKPGIIFIAEIYNPDQYHAYIQKGQFDLLYDKVLLYDTLRLLMAGQRNTTDIADIQSRLQGITKNMLHFMENHDEQRIASRFFAGDPWKALPAMLISATIDQGPVMIYFGQEVGEPGAGAEGFQSDDGRTTIFGYWGVPEHQKWMNDGKFDGGKLSAEQKQLRMFYSTLLNFAATSDAIARGEYRDITAHNVAQGNFSGRVHAFVRFCEEEKLLIVSSFNNTEENVTVQIPHGIFREMGLDENKYYVIRDMLWREVETGFDEKLSFSLKLKPHSTFIFKIK